MGYSRLKVETTQYKMQGRTRLVRDKDRVESNRTQGWDRSTLAEGRLKFDPNWNSIESVPSKFGRILHIPKYDRVDFVEIWPNSTESSKSNLAKFDRVGPSRNTNYFSQVGLGQDIVESALPKNSVELATIGLGQVILGRNSVKLIPIEIWPDSTVSV